MIIQVKDPTTGNPVPRCGRARRFYLYNDFIIIVCTQGKDPATGKSYEELYCGGTQSRGVAVLGDSNCIMTI